MAEEERYSSIWIVVSLTDSTPFWDIGVASSFNWNRPRTIITRGALWVNGSGARLDDLLVVVLDVCYGREKAALVVIALPS